MPIMNSWHIANVIWSMTIVQVRGGGMEMMLMARHAHRVQLLSGILLSPSCSAASQGGLLGRLQGVIRGADWRPSPTTLH